MNQSQQDRHLFFISLVVVVAVLWLKYKSALVLFCFQHRYLVAFIVALLGVSLYLRLNTIFRKWQEPTNVENEVLSPTIGDDSILIGRTDKDKSVHLKLSSRRMHTQVIGTTNAGKTESVILPLAVDDLKKGRGLIIIDGKSDRSLLNKLFAYAKRHHREDDVKILSLCSPKISHTFNPLAGGSPLEITERIFKALNFENEYFKNLQYETLLQTLLIFESCKIKPTPLRIVEVLRSPRQLKQLATQSGVQAQISWALDQLGLSREEREQRTSGLITQLQVLSIGDTSSIFNSEISDIDLDLALSDGHIIYCQLPVLKVPTLGKTVGKLILQCVQGAASSRHLGKSDNDKFFSVYLDDFTEYMTEGFVSLLNKSRSANVGVVFAHQALGDLATLGDAVQNTILTNANVKIFMRTNEPGSAEYFSKSIGTIEAEKVTERQQSAIFGSSKTGDGSVREVEEFKFHPNIFKQGLGIGEGVIILPHSKGSLPFRMKFRKLPDLDAPVIPEIVKAEPIGLPTLTQESKPSSIAKNILSVTDDRKEAA